MRFVFRIAVALIFVAKAPAIAADPLPQIRFQVDAMVEDGAIEEDGSVWFKPLFEDVRFVLPAGRDSRGDELWRLVIAANQSRRELKIWFDPASGDMDETAAIMRLPICSVSLDDARFNAPGGCGALPGAPTKKQELLIGWALHQVASHDESRKLLDRAIASKNVSASYRRLALRAHANLLESIGYETEPGSEVSDRAHLAALADFRALAQLETDVAEHVLDAGYQQEALGDYRGAEATYRQLMSKWPDEDYQANIRLAAIERRRGNDERALQLTNLVALKYPDQLGMKFYYHRGWTLTKLGRFDEAIADLTAGLKLQPDYAWAYARRACALSHIGRPNLALGDMEMTLKLLDQSPIGDRKDLLHDRARVRAIIAMLRTAVAAKSSKPIPEVCEGFWTSFERHRAPSPLLPH